MTGEERAAIAADIAEQLAVAETDADVHVQVMRLMEGGSRLVNAWVLDGNGHKRHVSSLVAQARTRISEAGHPKHTAPLPSREKPAPRYPRSNAR